MSWIPAPADCDPRTPVTVMITPAQEMRLELYLAQVRSQHPTADDLQVADLVFARGLDAVMEETTMQQDTPADVETACRRAYDNRYHKIPAAVGYDQWRDIWLDAMDHARTAPPLDYAAVLSKGESEGSGYGLPDKRQILITLGKLWAGCRPGDEMWCELDQECLDAALGLLSVREAGLMASDTPDFDQPGEFPSSIAQACAVLQNTLQDAGCCIHIDDSASVEVMFGEDDSIHCLPTALPDVLDALALIESHRPIPVCVAETEG